MAEARFHDACDALRARLREVEDEGWVSVEVRDEASRDASTETPAIAKPRLACRGKFVTDRISSTSPSV